MTPDNQNGHLPPPLEIEPTDRQCAAHELAAAFSAAGDIYWTQADESFRTLVGSSGHESLIIDAGRTAAARISRDLADRTGAAIRGP